MGTDCLVSDQANTQTLTARDKDLLVFREKICRSFVAKLTTGQGRPGISDRPT